MIAVFGRRVITGQHRLLAVAEAGSVLVHVLLGPCLCDFVGPDFVTATIFLLSPGEALSPGTQSATCAWVRQNYETSIPSKIKDGNKKMVSFCERQATCSQQRVPQPDTGAHRQIDKWTEFLP